MSNYSLSITLNNGETVIITVTHKKMRNIRMRLDDKGALKVSAPLRMSQAKVQKFVAENQPWIEKALAKQTQKQDLPYLIDEAELKSQTEQLFAYWQAQMGLYPERVRYRKMKTRWGVCNTSTKVITINTELAKYPLECLEYVIVHELAHLRHKGHQADFWTLVGQNLPNYKALRKMLRN